MNKPRVRVTIEGDHNIRVEHGRVDVNEGEQDFLNPDNDQAQTLLLVALLEEIQALRKDLQERRDEDLKEAERQRKIDALLSIQGM